MPPTQLSFQSVFTTRSILVAYWTVIILALPLWWHTTSIQRLSLPSSRVLAQADRELRFPVTLQLDSSFTAQDLSNIQQLLNNSYSYGLDVTVNAESSSSNTYSIVRGKDWTLRNRTFEIPDVDSSTLAQKLSSLLLPESVFSNPHVIQYAPRYRLAFTLMNEDSTDGYFISSWDVKSAILRHIHPVLSAVSVLHNFTIESQVQYHGPLAFRPQSIDQNTPGITQEDLTIFINSAEWTLSSSISEDPVLHFLLYIPAVSRPLIILDKSGAPSSSSAFILPQWGSVFIYNPSTTFSSDSSLPATDMDLAFSTFSSHLQILLGIPQLPLGVTVGDNSGGLLSPWQLDTLLRLRALESARSAKDTLRSTVKLVGQIENMPVDDFVRGDVQDALDALEAMHTWSVKSLTDTLAASARAMTRASRAFFYPGMLAMLYFPAEHKYAVYTPLFASAVVPLVAAVIREVLASRRNVTPLA